MGRFGCMMGRFGQRNGPFWTMFLEIKIFWAVLVGAVLAMGRFGIDPTLCLRNKHCTKLNTAVLAIPYCWCLDLSLYNATGADEPVSTVSWRAYIWSRLVYGSEYRGDTEVNGCKGSDSHLHHTSAFFGSVRTVRSVCFIAFHCTIVEQCLSVATNLIQSTNNDAENLAFSHNNFKYFYYMVLRDTA